MSTSRFMLAMLAVMAIMCALGAVYNGECAPKTSCEPLESRQAAFILEPMNVYPYIDDAFKSNPEASRSVAEMKPTVDVNARDAEIIAQAMYGEYRGPDKLQQAAVAWCILNRVGVPGFADTIEGVVKQQYQFHGYSPSNPVLPDLYDMAVDVMNRWELEKLGVENVGRVLPSEYKWFGGDGRENIFRDAYYRGQTWDWSLPNPYEVTE